jgi:hypothetical protein
VKVNREGSDVTESVPERSTNGEIHRLQFDSEAKTVERVNLRQIGLHDSERTGYVTLSALHPGHGGLYRDQLGTKCECESGGQPDLRRLPLASANLIRLSHILTCSSDVVLNRQRLRQGQGVD